MGSGESNQSSCWPRFNSKVAAPIAQASAMYPGKSMARALSRSRSLSAYQPLIMPRIPNGTMAKNAQRQLIASDTNPPIIGPNTGPNTPPMPHIINTSPCRCLGKLAINMP